MYKEYATARYIHTIDTCKAESHCSDNDKDQDASIIAFWEYKHHEDWCKQQLFVNVNIAFTRQALARGVSGIFFSVTFLQIASFW